MIFNQDAIKNVRPLEWLLLMFSLIVFGVIFAVGALTLPTEQEEKEQACVRKLLSVASGGASATQGELVISDSLTYKTVLNTARAMCSRNEVVTFSGQSSLSKLQGTLVE